MTDLLIYEDTPTEYREYDTKVFNKAWDIIKKALPRAKCTPIGLPGFEGIRIITVRNIAAEELVGVLSELTHAKTSPSVPYFNFSNDIIIDFLDRKSKVD